MTTVSQLYNGEQPETLNVNVYI